MLPPRYPIGASSRQKKKTGQFYRIFPPETVYLFMLTNRGAAYSRTGMEMFWKEKKDTIHPHISWQFITLSQRSSGVNHRGASPPSPVRLQDPVSFLLLDAGDVPKMFRQFPLRGFGPLLFANHRPEGAAGPKMLRRLGEQPIDHRLAGPDRRVD